jgi:hypothetical protein
VTGRFGWVSVLALLFGCGKTTSLDGRACPCAEGYVCCENQCVRATACRAATDGSDASPREKLDGPTVSQPQGDALAADSRDMLGDISIDVVRDGLGDLGPAAARYVDISAGPRLTCLVRGDGSIGCWGYTPPYSSPVPSGKFKQVSVGTNSACALALDGQLLGPVWAPAAARPVPGCIGRTSVRLRLARAGGVVLGRSGAGHDDSKPRVRGCGCRCRLGMCPVRRLCHPLLVRVAAISFVT